MKSVSLILLSLHVTSAFIFPERLKVKPGLVQIADAQTEKRLKIGLEIGRDNDDSRLGIKDMILDIKSALVDYDCVKMPGINGPHPKLSSGSRSLYVHQEGSFVGSMGKQLVKAAKGCWEMVWKDDAPAGSLLCGFEVPEDYQRNSAVLPKGRVYLSFPVWTKDGLEFARKKKEQILARAKELLEEKNEHMRKYAEEKNPLMKALHYRNAYAAADKYYMYTPDSMSLNLVPGKDEIVQLQDDLLLTTKGLVWSKELLKGKQTLLGTATIGPQEA